MVTPAAKKKKPKTPATKDTGFRVHDKAVDPTTVSRARLDAWRAECLAKFPTGAAKKYQVIYADPPWTYANMAAAIEGVPKYPVMTLDALKALPVARVADSTAVLFLWATNPLLEQAFELIRAWGFEYKTVFKTWLKRFPNGNPVVNMGYWSRPSTELLLVATRGSGYMKWKTTCSERQEHASVRGRHSEKPVEIRDQVRDFMRVDNRLELFARNAAPAWDAWGLVVPWFFK
jgi:N6-adenosine-specific RNA methylase IME4